MLTIDVSTRRLCVASHSPHAGYYICAAIVPGTPGEVLTLGPEHLQSNVHAAPGHSRMQFTLALHAAGDNRPPSHFSALLAPRMRETPQHVVSWEAVMEEIAKYVPSSSHAIEERIQLFKGILDITVCEWLTASMPRNSNGVEMDALVQQGLTNNHLSPAATSTMIIPTPLLTSRRIGHVRVPLLSLAQLWRSKYATGVERLPTTLSLQLYDINVLAGKPIYRGIVDLHIARSIYDAQLAPSTRQLLLRSTTLTGTNVYDDTYLPAAQVAQDLYAPYINAYLAPFPRFDEPFKMVKMTDGGAARSFHVLDDHQVLVGGEGRSKLHAEKNDMNNIHMPTARIDGLPANLPIHVLFDAISRKEEHTEWHDRFFGAICDACCAIVGNDSAGVAAVIHAYYNSPPKEITPAILAACRAYGLFVRYMSTALPYRSDVTIAGANGELGNGVTIQGTEDVARDGVTGVTAAVDCEDSGFVNHYIAAMLLQGSSTLKSPTEWQSRDPIWLNVYAPRGFAGGAWRHVGLDAFQRLQTRYAVVNILGTVTAAFPGESRAPATGIMDLDEAERLYTQGMGISPSAREIGKYIYTSSTNKQSSSEAHRWALALPLERLLRLILRSTDREDALGSVRHPADKAALTELRNALLYFTATTSPPLPCLTLEGTTPMDPYCVVGASHWLAESHPERSALRQIEARTRQLAILFRNAVGGKWHRYGAMHLDGGAYRHLPGNLPHRQGSQFYSRALQLDAWIVGRLAKNASSLTTFACTHDQDGAVWGVPVDRLLYPRLGDDIALVPVTHRISMTLRNQFDEAAKKLVPLLLPCRLGNVHPADPSILLPTLAKTTPTHLTPLGVESFAWEVYYLHGDMNTPESVIDEYRRTVVEGENGRFGINNQTLHFKQRLTTLGHSTLVWAVHQ